MSWRITATSLGAPRTTPADAQMYKEGPPVTRKEVTKTPNYRELVSHGVCETSH